MVWVPNHVPPLQQPAAPVRQDVKVVPAAAISDRRDRRSGSDANRRRRALFDFLMQEVHEIRELEPDQKALVRDNLRGFVQRQSLRSPDQPVPPPPSPEEAADTVVAAMAPAPSAELPADERENRRRLREEVRRLLMLHSDRATKIAAYIHGLMVATREVHVVDLDV
ncbi:hypothetical protein [Rhodocista pekingensis]|uniref:Uncharacterized protein n=1 Tax=Rhodocista pekingensis TaxID=201185 RepID=A0ABW2KSJ8_9PROT